jgi:hypothetical protein
MSTETVFRIHLVSGYVAWLLCFGVYILPKLRTMERFEAHRAIATLHSFRFFGLVFIVPGVIGNLPAGFATGAAYGDFWAFVVAFNVVGIADILIDYYHAVMSNLAATAGELGAMYAIPILYVPILVITHVVALYWLFRPQPAAASALSGAAA